MADPNEETGKRLHQLEETTTWLKDRVWYGTGNLHDRIHHLEDRSADRSFELEEIKGDVKKLQSVIGLNEYGDKNNLISDVRDMINTVNKLKDNVITVRDFQSLLSDVKSLKERGQAQISFSDKLSFVVINGVVSFIVLFLMTRIFGGAP
jgi:hypothetical protein